MPVAKSFARKTKNSKYEKHWNTCEKMSDTIWLHEVTKHEIEYGNFRKNIEMYGSMKVEAKMD